MGRLLFRSSGLVVTSLIAYAASPTWPGIVAGSLLAGLGAGAIDAGINAYAARHFAPKLMNWLHATWGVGALSGPLLMTAVLTSGASSSSWRMGYALVAAVLSLMAAGFYVTRNVWDERPAAPAKGGARAASLLDTLRRRPAQLNVILFFLYAGLEVSVGQWTYSLFVESRRASPALAGFAVSVYWGSLTLGRILAGVLAERYPSAYVLRAATCLAPVGALLLWRTASVSLVAMVVLGLSFAPVYPLLMSATPARVGAGRAMHAVGLQVGAAYLGTAAVPGTLGLLAEAYGLETLGPFLFGVALAFLALHEIALASSPSRRLDSIEQGA